MLLRKGISAEIKIISIKGMDFPCLSFWFKFDNILVFFSILSNILKESKIILMYNTGC